MLPNRLTTLTAIIWFICTLGAAHAQTSEVVLHNFYQPATRRKSRGRGDPRLGRQPVRNYDLWWRLERRRGL
jgi:hypothetical protein